jgi:hypothetical protein
MSMQESCIICTLCSNAANYQQLFDAHYELYKTVFDDQGDRGKIIFN